MAVANVTRYGPRGHLRVIPLAGAASVLLGGAASWAQTPLPYCPVYPPGAAPAIGPSNCTPVPSALWGDAPRGGALDVGADPPGPPPPPAAPAAKPKAPASPTMADAARAAGSAEPPKVADAPPTPTLSSARKPSGLQAAIGLRTPEAVTLEQIGALLGPVSGRTVTFALAPADQYKKSDLTHRVRLTWAGTLQALLDQLAQIYGLDVAVDDSAIRFSSRPASPAGGASTPRTP